MLEKAVHEIKKHYKNEKHLSYSTSVARRQEGGEQRQSITQDLLNLSTSIGGILELSKYNHLSWLLNAKFTDPFQFCWANY